MEKVFKPFFISLILLFAFTESKGQVFDNNLTVNKNDSLQYSKRGNRSEGFYVSEISQHYNLSLANLTCGPVNYELSDTEIIKIEPLFKTKDTIHIQASSLQLRKYYRMDAEISADTIFHWPVADVLKPASLPSDKIGIFGKLVNGDNQYVHYMPLKVYSKNLNPDNCGQLLLRFSTNIDLDRVIYTFEGSEGVKETKAMDKTIFYAGKPIDIELEVNFSEMNYFFYMRGRVYDPAIKTDEKNEKCENIDCFFIIDLSK